MNPPNDPPEVNVNGQTSTIEKPQTSSAISAKNVASGMYETCGITINSLSGL